ncbi:MAG: protein kinase [Acidobacteriota bacterium]|nr:protein kinase [Acidobacteriota bacterium]
MHPVLTSGDRLGAYEITGLLGSGGMGEVYKARDTRLDRSVAIKVIKANSGAPEQWRQRFEREARAISALSHPRICSLFDVGREGGTDFLVLEYLEGETLQARLRKGPLPVDQALSIAVQIAEGLEHAHRRGVLHRDLKPANVMLTKSNVKLMDFGLAKIVAKAAAIDAGASLQATLTTEGTIAGTLQYMAPEQLEGKEPSEAGDIFSFGAVLFEMITGRHAFEGNSPASVIAAVMKSTPPAVHEIRPMSPRGIDRLIRQCLEKNPEERWESVRDLKTALQWMQDDIGKTGIEESAGKPPRRTSKWLWIPALLLPVLGAIAFVRLRPEPAAVAKPIHFLIQPPEHAAFAGDEAPAVSPDGEKIAFVGIEPNGKRRLWVRPLDAARAEPVTGTDEASEPFWSPDGKSIGFFANQKLKTVGADGSSIHTLSDVPEPFGAAWGSNMVLFATGLRLSQIFRAPVGGGDFKPVDGTVLERGEIATHWPFFLPGERRFIFYLTTTDRSRRGVYAGSMDSRGKREMVVASETNAEFARTGGGSGYLVYEREGKLMARVFAPGTLRFAGEPIVVAEQVAFNVVSRQGFFSAANDRVCAYRAGGPTYNWRLVWWDRTGKELGPLAGPGDYALPRISRDGSRVVAMRADVKTGGYDIWSIDTTRGVPTRLTFDSSDSVFPVPSPDGSRVVFNSNRKIMLDIYESPAGGSGADKLLFQSNEIKVLRDWSPDGRFILYTTPTDIWALPVSGGKPLRIMQNRFRLGDVQISPDGKYLAYESDESGRPEVYVRRFEPEHDNPGPKWQISSDGGSYPAWDPAGREIYYIAGDQNLVSVRIDSSFPARSEPKPLFKVPIDRYGGGIKYVVQNANRFLMVKPEDNRDTAPLHVIVNWAAGLRH